VGGARLVPLEGASAVNAWGATAAAVAAVLLVASSLAPASRSDPPMAPEAGFTLRGGLAGLPATGTLVVDGPTQAYASGEAEALRAFLERGGRLVVVEATPASSSLVHALGAGVEASTATLFDPDVDGQGRLTVTGTGALGVTGAVALARTQVALGGTPVLASAPFAWRDDDRDGLPGLEEPRGTWSAAAVQAVGAGAILVVGARAFLDLPPIRAWVEERGPLVADGAHAARDDPVGTTALLAGERPVAVGLGLLAAALVAAAVAWRVRVRRGRPARRRSPLDRETLEILAELGE
jgi:hypothetical protein